MCKEKKTITFKWSDTQKRGGYKLYCNTWNSPIATVSAGVTSVTIPRPDLRTKQVYWLTAFEDGLESAPTNTVSVGPILTSPKRFEVNCDG